MSSLRALETNTPLERFVELTEQIRALETERNALKATITEALQHEPSGENGEHYVDFGGYRVSLATRPSYRYSDEVKRLEKQVRDLKAKERKTGTAFITDWGFHPRCTAHQTTSEEEARKKKASAIAAYLERAGLDRSAVEQMKQVERDAIARRAGQRSP